MTASALLAAGVRRVDETPSVAIIDLTGEIEASADAVLNAAYAEAIEPNPRVVLLNFAGVDYINSTGIALIVGLLAQTRKAGRRLFTTGLSEHYREIFEITRLSDFMSICPDEASALAAASQPPAN
jgi:anti-anti-sigma factor